MSIRGGGERSTLALAHALRALGYEAEIVTCSPFGSPEQTADFFGQEFSQVPVTKSGSRDIEGRMSGGDLDFFVNHSFREIPRNCARIGIYMQMFPYARIDSQRTPEEFARLQTYNLLVNNSEFTKSFSDQWWEFPNERSVVLHPPIASRFIARGKQFLLSPPQKKKQILNVGRFTDSPNAHNKNQHVIVKAFLAARESVPALSDWTLLLVGTTFKDDHSLRALEAVTMLVEKAPDNIQIVHDVSLERLSDLMAESHLYVHAAGAFEKTEESAFQCEHLGLSIIEAMVHGCVPLVFNRGGALELFDSRDKDYTYDTFEGLVRGIEREVSRFDQSLIDYARFERHITKALAYNFPAYTQRLEQLLRHAEALAPSPR